MTNHMTKTAATARHRKDLDPTNPVETNTRWWVITYAPDNAPYLISDRPRIVAATFAALEVTEDGAIVAAFYRETDLAGRRPASCVRRVTAECADITGYDTWETAVAVAYPDGQPDTADGWDTDQPLTQADLDAVFAHFDAPLPVPAESDEEWLRRLATTLGGLPDGVVPLRRPRDVWADADPFTPPSRPRAERP